MKKIILMVLLIFMPMSFADAFPNEPNGYGQLYWGESLADVKKTYNTEFLGYAYNYMVSMYLVTIYDTNGELGLTGKVKAICEFTQGRLYSIVIFIGRNPQDIDRSYTSAHNYLTGICGPSYKQGKYDVWNGKTTLMGLSRSTNGLELYLIDESFVKGLAIGLKHGRSKIPTSV